MPSTKLIKKTYKITGMNCPSCATLIEIDLEDMGMKASCSYAKSELAIEVDCEKFDEIKLKEVIKKSGYDLSP